ncbi:MAG: pyridoxamine 5'-phosphate oxidase [Bacteroidota bacterium]|nr:pyridoxamine 5'-phosphate oxidase [Bacteroidota bacterium]
MEDPINQFNNWLEAAFEEGIKEHNSMVLSTVSELGKPSARVVFLKGHSSKGLLFFTNYNSRKAKDIMSNHHASLLFYWKELERQIRIEGIVRKASAEESDTYFHSRSFESNLSAVSSPQSAVIADRNFLLNRIALIRKENTIETIRRPLYWGGFKLIPEYFEFWQAGKARLHDRVSYTLENGEWVVERLAP